MGGGESNYIKSDRNTGNPGDIVFYDKTAKTTVVADYNTFDATVFPETQYYPIGIIVVPPAHNRYSSSGTGSMVPVFLSSENFDAFPPNLTDVKDIMGSDGKSEFYIASASNFVHAYTGLPSPTGGMSNVSYTNCLIPTNGFDCYEVQEYVGIPGYDNIDHSFVYYDYGRNKTYGIIPPYNYSGDTTIKYSDFKYGLFSFFDGLTHRNNSSEGINCEYVCFNYELPSKSGASSKYTQGYLPSIAEVIYYNCCALQIYQACRKLSSAYSKDSSIRLTHDGYGNLYSCNYRISGNYLYQKGVDYYGEIVERYGEQADWESYTDEIGEKNS